MNHSQPTTRRIDPLWIGLGVFLVAFWLLALLGARAVLAQDPPNEYRACVRALTAGLVMPPGEVLAGCEWPRHAPTAEECARRQRPKLSPRMVAECQVAARGRSGMLPPATPPARWPKDTGGCRYYLPPVDAAGSDQSYIDWWAKPFGAPQKHPLKCGSTTIHRQPVILCPGLQPWVMQAEVWREIEHASGTTRRVAGDFYRVAEAGSAIIRWGVSNAGTVVVSGNYPFDFPCTARQPSLFESNGFEAGGLEAWSKVVP